eukprot:CAMPEP_0119160490 /NCGR_PEP_ID=MMETSP1315-20130426/413_1 /TAXON_ID=676789 /ORGANISM="Prasinoderma singularis, Strain RCC927" /LENGTH=70 /DNA_ID=CAMNT_0007153147 /DNA_START=537 /DNA_END=749 /DNA_ORIENTATION=+
MRRFGAVEHVFLTAVQRGFFGRAIQRGRAAGKGSRGKVGRALQGVHSADCGDRVASTAQPSRQVSGYIQA